MTESHYRAVEEPFRRHIRGARCPASTSNVTIPSTALRQLWVSLDGSWKLAGVSTSSPGQLFRCCTMLLAKFLLVPSLNLPSRDLWLLLLVVPSTTAEESLALHFCICPSESCRLLLACFISFSLWDYAASASLHETCAVSLWIHLPSSNIKVILNILLRTFCYWQNCQ